MKQTENGNGLSLPEVPSLIEAATLKLTEDAVSWEDGPSGTWMCHDPSKDRMSSRGMGHLPRARRPRPKPTLLSPKPEVDASISQAAKPTLQPADQNQVLRRAIAGTAAAPADTRRRLG